MNSAQGAGAGGRNASFVRFGGVAGILLAVTSLLTVGEYFALVPAAQRLPVTDVPAYLTSLEQQTVGSSLYYGLYALIAFWAVIGIPAVYFRLRAISEGWAFFATLTGEIAAVGTMVNALGEIARLRYLSTLAASSAQSFDLAHALYHLPSAVNPLGALSFGLTAVWYLVITGLMWRSDLPKLLAIVGLIAFLDLAAGFIASVGEAQIVATYAALIAGAVGGPVFWAWLGALLMRDANNVG